MKINVRTAFGIAVLMSVLAACSGNPAGVSSEAESDPPATSASGGVTDGSECEVYSENPTVDDVINSVRDGNKVYREAIGQSPETVDESVEKELWFTYRLLPSPVNPTKVPALTDQIIETMPPGAAEKFGQQYCAGLLDQFVAFNAYQLSGFPDPDAEQRDQALRESLQRYPGNSLAEGLRWCPSVTNHPSNAQMPVDQLPAEFQRYLIDVEALAVSTVCPS